jgi:hypothetical protein
VFPSVLSDIRLIETGIKWVYCNWINLLSNYSKFLYEIN